MVWGVRGDRNNFPINIFFLRLPLVKLLKSLWLSQEAIQTKSVPKSGKKSQSPNQNFGIFD